MVQVRVPTPLRKFTGGAEAVQANGTSVATVVSDLDKQYPGIKDRICDETGAHQGEARQQHHLAGHAERATRSRVQITPDH